MRLTTFTDYSLRVLIHLAAQPDGRATIAQIAAAFGISENHLTKVVHFLGRAGFLANVRGRGGGLRLARAARDINVGAVVRKTEGAAMPAECFDLEHNQCAISRICRLRGVLKEAVDAFYAVLARYTLEDLVEPGLARASPVPGFGASEPLIGGSGQKGMAKIFKAWQCIGCGRIDGPQNCIGVCEDRKAEFVHAFEYEDAIGRAERAEARVQALESFLRRLALTTPRADAWQRSYTNLQAEARRLLSADATALQPAAPDVSERPAADRG